MIIQNYFNTQSRCQQIVLIAASLALAVGLFLTWTALDLRATLLSVAICLSVVLPTAHTKVMLELYAEVLQVILNFVKKQTMLSLLSVFEQ